jgi:hypothetical protein
MSIAMVGSPGNRFHSAALVHGANSSLRVRRPAWQSGACLGCPECGRSSNHELRRKHDVPYLG